jgi:hypothetical protein
MRNRLTRDERLIIAEAARIKRRISEMADNSSMMQAIITGKIKDLAGANLRGADLSGAIMPAGWEKITKGTPVGTPAYQ